MRREKVFLIIAALVLCGETAIADLKTQKEKLEVDKLDLEVRKLREDRGRWDDRVTVGVSLFLGIAGGLLSFWTAHRTRLGALDQATHEKRLEHYPKLVAATSPLAIYFPGDGTTALAPQDCRAMGRTMSKWYFDKGGLLMSQRARDAYFDLARALTRASFANALSVPTFPDDAERISRKKLREYRKTLEQLDVKLDKVEEWQFGSRAYLEFQDYVFLQHLSSLLRTALSEDLRSRRRPS